jgi:AcrR family transcriptional regulator
MANTRDEILTAAAEIFRRNGFNGASVKDITVAAHATMGSLYHFFPGGKEQLTVEVLRTTGAAYLQLFELIADGASDPGDAVRQFFDGAADVLVETDFIDICPIGSIAREVASTSEPLRRVSNEVFASWQLALATRLRVAGLRPAAAGRLATTVVAALEGGFILTRTARDPALLRTIGRAMRGLVDEAITAATISSRPDVR